MLQRLQHVLLRTRLAKDHLQICRSSTRSKTMVNIHADPSPALVDDFTKYTVNGLQPAQDITIAASLTEQNTTYISHGHYQTDNNGCVDLSQQLSLGGSFTGKEPMGLLWAMKPEKGSKSGVRLSKKDVTVPFDVNLTVIDGHHDIAVHTDISERNVLCKMSHPRTYMGAGVRRLLVREGRLRGALYLPPGVGPFPGVIDLFGTAGGLTEFRSALLASRGFASFALAYFGYDDLNKGMAWDMEYFEEAVDFMTTHPNVNPGGIATIGVSKGTELISYMSIYSPLVKAVVSIGPYHYYSLAEHRKDGKKLPTIWPAWGDLAFEDGRLVIDEAYWKAEVTHEEALIQIEKAEGAEFLFINGGDDRMADVRHTDILIERLKNHGKDNYRLLRYPGAGHLIEPPYTPYSRTAFHKIVGSEMVFGGETRAHALAQEQSWSEILAFFRRRLNVQTVPAHKL